MPIPAETAPYPPPLSSSGVAKYKPCHPERSEGSSSFLIRKATGYSTFGENEKDPSSVSVN
jgi:hypothetical protein